MKKIPEQKLQAFSVGSMGTRGLSKRELEEQRKKEEEEAAAHVFKEFVETFQEVPSSTSKVWVKAGTYDAGARKEDTSERGKLYKPVSRLEEKRPSTEDVVRALAAPRPLESSPARLKAKHAKDKKKSNLELFKEELRQIQEEREERHKYKSVLRNVLGDNASPAAVDAHDMGSYDTGDPNTTNLYLGNLNPKITEQQLKEIFGRYGPLASIKIMWPRSDEEKARGRNCGFVAFMSRKDGERALRCINGKEVMNYEMKLGWGKAVVIPPVPIYIPPALQQPSAPPPPSGLPFNAQPPRHLVERVPRVRPGESLPADPADRELYEQILAQSIVKVVVPTERNILMLIHRMVEFVIREGPMFEAVIMNKEINNPFFRFLFENQSAAHVYYRWKLFSMLQGDTPKQWALNDFRMFKGGSVWRPPVMNLYTAGMPDELVDEDDVKENIRGTLSNNQRDRLEELVRNLTPERGAVAEAMAWCLEHAEAAGEIAECLAEALTGAHTAPHRRVARLYLLSDILHNAGAKLSNASAFRNALQQRLPEVVRAARRALIALPSRLQAEGFRARITRVLQAWADWAVYPTEFLLHLNDLFLGRDKESGAEGGAEPEPELMREVAEVAAGGASPAGSSASEGSWEGSGGAGPLDGAALRRLAATRLAHPTLAAPAGPVAPPVQPVRRTPFEDIDGVPMEEDIDGVPLEVEGADGDLDTRPAAGFVPSRWESVEPAAVEAGAVTTSQWQRLAEHEPEPEPEPEPDLERERAAGGAAPGDEQWAARRAALRELELKVLKYADELEAGRRALRPGLDAHQQVQHYRRKLLKKAAREAREAEEARVESPEPRRRSPLEEDQHSTSSRKSKKTKELSLSPPARRTRHGSRTRSRSRERDTERSRDRDRERDRDRDRDRDRERERERERRRRSPATPPHHHRKHKHAKHKY